MSSHHIVREKQEPALLVLNLDGFSEEMLGQLLEWSPTVITTPLTAEQIDAAGIKIDIIIADTITDILQSDVKLLVPVERDPLVAALTFLVDNGYPSVNVIADKADVNTTMQFAGKINIVVFAQGQKIFAINSGFTKWKPAGEQISILSAPGNLQTTGLTTVNDGNCVTTADGFVTFTFTAPYLLIAEDI